MNCEEQAVDLCNAIDLCNVPDNTISHPVDEILPRDGLLLMDGDQGQRDATVLTRLKDVHPKDDDSTELKAPHSKNNGSVAVSADPVNGSDGDLQQTTSKFEEPPVSRCSVGDGGGDDGEMDIGVDLSLDENGVLEFEPTAQTQNEESASHCENSLTSETVIELHSQQPLEERREDVSSETTSAATTPGNGAGIKHGSKRVTFPSDEDIVSGAVEPKDPWRHGSFRGSITTAEICCDPSAPRAAVSQIWRNLSNSSRRWVLHNAHSETSASRVPSTSSSLGKHSDPVPHVVLLDWLQCVRCF
ncbi:protein phosphatase 1 regulatory subunit 37-like [Sinocyclocheilus rhinocerous]|uniref:protein phosphatase 1 regulatory subunit 37-like n=1 Tax=Sinocyclocheilus rhinocerous TaxID=307959 RepID=UPI0007B9038E|nr:PREDICTED: protein phosphatase 1 regulatory subunit 37-like [Sinocyclocheilus rhinocerous]